MTARRLEKYRRWLGSPNSTIGRWRQGRALRALMGINSADAARIIAETLLELHDELTREKAVQWLTRLKDQPAIDAVCAVWAERRDSSLEKIVEQRGWIAANPTTLRVLTALKTSQFDAVTDGGPAIVEPLWRSTSDTDSLIAQRACECLSKLQRQPTIDVLCARWAETRDNVLAGALVKARYVAHEPVSVRVLTALKNGKPELLLAGDAEIVQPLLHACSDSERGIANAARDSLGRLSEPDAREELCRRAVESDQPLAREIARAAKFAPRHPVQRALFYFLTEQWEAYEALDFDQSLLGSAYAAGDPTLRGRVAERARLSGRTEWMRVLAGSRQERALEEMSDSEWETTVWILSESRRWADLWKLAQVAPANSSVRLLRRLADSQWKPERDRELEGFTTLMDLAQRCSTEPPFLGRFVRCVQTLEAHTDHISSLAITRDNQQLVTGSNDGTLRLWSIKTGTALKSFEGHSDWICAAALSPDGSLVAGASRDHTARLWSLRDDECRKTLTGHTDEVRCLGFSRDGKLLATGSADKTVRLWRIPSGECAGLLVGHSDIVSCLAVSPNGQLLATGSYDNQVRLWTLPEGLALAPALGHNAMVNVLAFASDSQTLVSGSKDRSVLVWTLPVGGGLSRLKGHRDDVSCLALSPDGRWLASGSWDTTIRLWSFPEGEHLETLGAVEAMDGHIGWVNCIAFAPDSRVLASGGSDNRIWLWSVPGGAPLKLLEGHSDRVSCLAFTPDGRTLVSGGWDGKVRVWKSELARLRELPVSRSTLQDLLWIENALANSALSDIERSWLQFLLGLIQWRRRHDIFVDDAAHMAVGEFDIEISG